MALKRKPWKKNLYQNHGYEDNYTDPSFLKDLQKNRDVKTFNFMEAFIGAAKLNQQISVVTAFLIVFYFLYMENVSPETVLLNSSIATLLGYVMFITLDKVHLTIIFDDSKTVLSVLVFGFIFSPLLHTLTDSISTDTIFSTTFFVMFFHLMFFDYGLQAYMVSKAISLNAAIFGSICLASRLASSFHAFVLLAISVEFFVLIPILLKRIWTPFILIPTIIICSYLLFIISLSVLITYLFIIVFINIICPYIFVSQQKYKNNIHGPWDEAIVKDADLVGEM